MSREPGDGRRDAVRAGEDDGALRELLVSIAQTPAPTGAERARGELVAGYWRDAGLEPRFDEVGNVIAELAGQGPRVLVACHLDSVFGPDVDVTVNRDQERWVGAGLGDNAASLAVLTRWVQEAAEAGAGEARPHLTLVATVGEEGLGDLRGARHAVAQLGEAHDLFVALDGYLGSITDQAVGSRRFEARFKAAGGHSWGDYPSPSATHAAGAAIARLAALHVPRTPRSSLNVGQVWGGTSINAIAESAGFNLDLRSVDAGALARLEETALDAIAAAASEHEAALEMVMVGDRPTGSVDNRSLVKAAREAYEAAGVKAATGPGSTDANAAVAAGLPSLSFGVYRGGNAHRLDEWVDPATLAVGLRAWRELLARLARLSRPYRGG